MREIQIGDKVAYSVQFLKAIFESHGPLAHARGVIVDLQPLGQTTLAKIDWQDDDIPAKVNTANLAIVGPNIKFCQC